MANETIMQGLLESLMQRPQDTAQQRGTVLANLISQPNPLAATVAYMMPGQLENVAGAARGLFGLKAPVSPLQEAQQAIAANPQLLADPTWLTQKAQELSAIDPALGMRFAAGAVSAQQAQAEKSVDTTILGLARNTNIAAVDQAIKSIPDVAKYPGLSAMLEGYKNQLAAEKTPSEPDKVQSTLSSMFTRAKIEPPKEETFQFQAEWDAWKQGQAPGADVTYPAFLTWKAALTRQDTEYDNWAKENPNKTIEDFWRAKESVKGEGRDTATEVATPTAREADLARGYLTRVVGASSNILGVNLKSGVSSEDMGVLTDMLTNEAARLKKEKGGSVQDNFQTALVNLRNSGAISVDAKGNVIISQQANPIAPSLSAEDFYK